MIHQTQETAEPGLRGEHHYLGPSLIATQTFLEAGEEVEREGRREYICEYMSACGKHFEV